MNTTTTPAGAKPAPSNLDLCKGLMALARGDRPLSWLDRVLLGQVMARLAPPATPAEPAGWREALQYYAEKSHFTISDEDAWDTVSGEPQNFWCDEAGTATVEDGTVAAMALRGAPIALDPEEFECCGRPVVGAEYMGQQEMVCCGNPEPKGESEKDGEAYRVIAIDALAERDKALGQRDELRAALRTAEEALTAISHRDCGTSPGDPLHTIRAAIAKAEGSAS